jgi:hypothetical protein
LNGFPRPRNRGRHAVSGALPDFIMYAGILCAVVPVYSGVHLTCVVECRSAPFVRVPSVWHSRDDPLRRTVHTRRTPSLIRCRGAEIGVREPWCDSCDALTQPNDGGPKTPRRILEKQYEDAAGSYFAVHINPFDGNLYRFIANPRELFGDLVRSWHNTVPRQVAGNGRMICSGGGRGK